MRKFPEDDINQTFLQHAKRYGFRRRCLESQFNVRSSRTVLTKNCSLLGCEAAPSFACYTLKMKSIRSSETSTTICLQHGIKFQKTSLPKFSFRKRKYWIWYLPRNFWTKDHILWTQNGCRPRKFRVGTAILSFHQYDRPFTFIPGSTAKFDYKCGSWKNHDKQQTRSLELSMMYKPACALHKLQVFWDVLLCLLYTVVEFLKYLYVSIFRVKQSNKKLTVTTKFPLETLLTLYQASGRHNPPSFWQPQILHIFPLFLSLPTQSKANWLGLINVLCLFTGLI